MRKSTLGQVITEKTREKISNANKGKIWVNDGKISTKINPVDFDTNIWVKGRMPFTKNIPGTNCKFTNKEILSIRKQLNKDGTIQNRRKIAELYNVSTTTINSIYFKKSYKNGGR